MSNPGLDLAVLNARMRGGSESSVVTPDGAPEKDGEVTMGFQDCLPEAAHVPHLNFKEAADPSADPSSPNFDMKLI